MKAKKYCSSLGTTASCVRRLLDAAVSFETKKREHEQRQNEKDNINSTKEIWDYDDIDEARIAARALGLIKPKDTTESESQVVSVQFYH